jgi:hypothetical protein
MGEVPSPGFRSNCVESMNNRRAGNRTLVLSLVAGCLIASIDVMRTRLAHGLLELARVVVCLNHAARFIVNANHRVV